MAHANTRVPSAVPGADRGHPAVDVIAVRAAHPIQEVVAAAGVQLHPNGRGWMAQCPFHDDTEPSLSVAGVPDRFRCFGCGAGGDVIEFVQRLHNVPFLDAVRLLDAHALGPRHTALNEPTVPRLRAVPDPDPGITEWRAHEVNALAWRFYGSPVATESAHAYLRAHRGIDLAALTAQHPGRPIAGMAGTRWTGLVDHLRRDGVTDDELLATDLARTSPHGGLHDALRDRLIVPVTRPDGHIDAFIGRDLSGRPYAPKYCNPTRTATYDKSTTLYHPVPAALEEEGNLLVVEGTLDALAIAAAAAQHDHGHRFAACTTSGLSVSAAQAGQVLAASVGPPVIALDGDAAGSRATMLWLSAICLDGGRPALVTRLPDGLDPAEWLHRQGRTGLAAFDRQEAMASGCVRPHYPGRALARLLLHRHPGQPDVVASRLADLADQLLPEHAAALLDQATAEMTRMGWNANQEFERALRRTAGPSLPAPLASSADNVARRSLPPYQAPQAASIERPARRGPSLT